MTDKQIIAAIRKDLKANIDEDYKKGAEIYDKADTKSFGVRVPVIRKISQNYFQLVKNWPLQNFLCFCEKLSDSNYSELGRIARDWAFKRRREYQKSDFKTFEIWLKKYVSGWASCDDLCGHLLGWFVLEFPELTAEIKTWSRSKNKWLRRASAVVLIPAVRQGKYLQDIFITADVLLTDKDDLVQKGYGWVLKEASRLFQHQVFDFIMARKHRMPRTALRYAIEKMPQAMRQKAMK